MTAATGGYRVVVRLPGAVPAFAWAGLARLGYGVLPLALLLFLSARRESFAEAGAAIAGYGLTAAVLGPARARTADRFGAGRVLVVLGVLFVAGACLVVVTAGGPLPVLLAAAVLAGTVPPPVGPVMRSVWRRLCRADEDRVRAAYALDAVAEEVLFVAGPLLGGVLVAAFGGGAVVVGTVVGLLVAVVGMTGCRAVRSGSAGAVADDVGVGTLARDGSRRPLWRVQGFLVGLGPVTGLGLLLGVVEVAGVAAVVASAGARAGGWPGAVVSAGSLVGGFVYGRRRWPGRTVVQSVALTIAACGAVALAGAVSLVPDGAAGGSLAALGGVLLVLGVAGLALSPAIVVSYLLADERAPVAGAESTAWVNSAFNLGTAAGVLVAGLVVDAAGASAALVVGAATAAVIALLGAFGVGAGGRSRGRS